MSQKRGGCGGCLVTSAVVIVGTMAGLYLLGKASSPDRRDVNVATPAPASTAPDQPKKWVSTVGSVGKLGYPQGGGSIVWVCVDEVSWDDMLDAQNDGAKGGPGSQAQLTRLIQAGKVKVYPVGTKVRVVKSGIFSRKVLILDGEDQGDSGWIQLEEVLPP